MWTLSPGVPIGCKSPFVINTPGRGEKTPIIHPPADRDHLKQTAEPIDAIQPLSSSSMILYSINMSYCAIINIVIGS